MLWFACSLCVTMCSQNNRINIILSVIGSHFSSFSLHSIRYFIAKFFVTLDLLKFPSFRRCSLGYIDGFYWKSDFQPGLKGFSIYFNNSLFYFFAEKKNILTLMTFIHYITYNITWHTTLRNMTYKMNAYTATTKLATQHFVSSQYVSIIFITLCLVICSADPLWVSLIFSPKRIWIINTLLFGLGCFRKK